MSIRIGTSGWNYPEWAGTFYTEKKNWLQQYAKHFDTVEINNSFYRLPSEETLLNWKNSVPKDFIFSVKASRFITHMKKLKGGAESFAKFFDRIMVLQEKTGPLLFQLPPRWNCNLERLYEFIRQLPAGYRYVFEFRDASWYRQEVYELLKSYNCAFCIYHLVTHQSPLLVTSDFVYVRLHGDLKDYYGNYSDVELRAWADRILNWKKNGKEIYIYFDNTRGEAIKNAKRLKELVGI